MEKRDMNAEQARIAIDTIVSEYKRVEVGIYITHLCKRYMYEYDMSKEEFLYRLAGSLDHAGSLNPEDK